MDGSPSRRSFVAALGGLAVAPTLAAPVRAAVGDVTTQAALFGAMRPPVIGDWIRIILGTGVAYQKQIGIGSDPGTGATYIETQVGSPGGSCNPNSTRKAYLTEPVGSLIEQYRVSDYVERAGNLIFREGGEAKPPPRLRLLDESYLFDDRPVTIVRRAKPTLQLAGRSVETTYVAGRFAPPRTARDRLRTIELWLSPVFPFGFAKYRATGAGVEPFEAHVYSHGTRFVTDLAVSLAAVREKTKDGAYMFLGAPAQ